MQEAIISWDQRKMERKEKENPFMEAEVDRILYVAATRGKSVLIVADAIG